MPLSSILLHKVLSHSPHARPLSINIHRDRGSKAGQLDTTNCQKGLFRSVVVEPVVEKEGEDETMENIYTEDDLANASHEREDLPKCLLLEKLRVTNASPAYWR